MSNAPSGKNSAWRSPWVRAWVGLILVFVSANMVMVVMAVRTNPGLVVADYYERGQHYEQTMLSRLANQPPWHSSIDLPAVLRVGQGSPIYVSIFDPSGEPVDVDLATFYAYRPSDTRYDFQVPMQREARGRYRADVSFPLVGIWDVLVNLKLGEDDDNLGHRIAVTQP